MKEIIIDHLKTVQSVLDDKVYPLKDKHDQFGRFNYYWDVLDFINWLKQKDPTDYEVYDLETCFEILDEFGYVFVRIVEPYRLQYAYRHNDGILNIDVPIQQMIRKFYDYAIGLQEDELLVATDKLTVAEHELMVAKEAIATGTASFTQVMEMLAVINTNVNKVGSAVQNMPVIDPADLAEKFVEHVANPPKPEQKMTKTERLQAEATKRIAQEDLKELQKRHSYGK
jgi:hypothetical protein